MFRRPCLGSGWHACVELILRVAADQLRGLRKVRLRPSCSRDAGQRTRTPYQTPRSMQCRLYRSELDSRARPGHVLRQPDTSQSWLSGHASGGDESATGRQSNRVQLPSYTHPPFESFRPQSRTGQFIALHLPNFPGLGEAQDAEPKLG